MPPKEWEHPVFTVTVEEVSRTEYYIRAESVEEAEAMVLRTKPGLLANGMGHGQPAVISTRTLSTVKEEHSQ